MQKAWTVRTLAVFVVLFPVLEGLSNSVLPIGTKFLGVALVSVWFLETAWLRQTRAGWLVVLFMLYCAWVAASVLWSAAPGVSFAYAFIITQAVVLFWVVRDVCADPKVAKVILRCYLAGIAVLAATAIPNILSGTTYAGLHNRFSALGFDPNSFGMYVVSTLPIVLSPAIVKFRGVGPFRALYLVLAGFVVFSTASRSSTAAFLVILAATALFYFRAARTSTLRAVAVAILVVAGILGGVLLAPEAAIERIEGGADDAAEGRLAAWALAWRYAAGSPMVGTGAGTLGELTKADFEGGLQAHSTFLSNFAELGVIGLGLWGLIWIIHFWLIGRIVARPGTRQIGATLFLVSLVLLIAALTLNWEARKPLYLIFGIVAALALPKRPVRWGFPLQRLARTTQRTEI